MKRLLIFIFCLLPLAARAQHDYAPLNDAVKEHLINLINIDTSQPYPDETSAARYIYKVLNKNKIDWDIYRLEKPRANLIAALKADKEAAKQNPQPALLMLAHLDTAPVQGAWETPPTKATLKDGRVYGLGASDAKNYAAVNLAILTWLKQNNIRLNRDIIFVFTADEEAGGAKGIKYLYDKYPQKLKAGFALNEGGGFIDKNILFVEAASKMYMDILVTAAGDGGHPATQGPANAIYKLSQALALIQKHSEPLHATPLTMNFFEKVYPLQDDDAKTTIGIFLRSADYAQREQAAKIISEDPFFKTQLMDTISPTVLTAGEGGAAQPAEASAMLNCRLLPDSNPMQFFARLAAWFENDDAVTLTITERPELPFPQPDPYSNDALFKAIEKSVEELQPGTLALAGISPASNESEFLRRRGVTAYGIGPHMARDGSGPHQADENIAEEDLYQQLQLTLAIVLNFAEFKQPASGAENKNGAQSGGGY